MFKFTPDEQKRRRVCMIGYYKKYGGTKASKYFGIPRSTLYDWIKRYINNGEDGIVNKGDAINDLHKNKIIQAALAGGSATVTCPKCGTENELRGNTTDEEKGNG